MTKFVNILTVLQKRDGVVTFIKGHGDDIMIYSKLQVPSDVQNFLGGMDTL